MYGFSPLDEINMTRQDTRPDTLTGCDDGHTQLYIIHRYHAHMCRCCQIIHGNDNHRNIHNLASVLQYIQMCNHNTATVSPLGITITVAGLMCLFRLPFCTLKYVSVCVSVCVSVYVYVCVSVYVCVKGICTCTRVSEIGPACF